MLSLRGRHKFSEFGFRCIGAIHRTSNASRPLRTYTATQRYQYTAIEGYTLYNLYNTPQRVYRPAPVLQTRAAQLFSQRLSTPVE